ARECPLIRKGYSKGNVVDPNRVLQDTFTSKHQTLMLFHNLY
ncbi:hypothetical protein TorRG33x02_056900, partial [Trema orientale]